MKTFLLENRMHRNENEKLIELIGLSRSGKTTLLKEIIKDGGNGFIDWENISNYRKLFAFFIYSIKNPIKLFVILKILNGSKIRLKNLKFNDCLKIFFMRNSYILAVLAKYEIMKNRKEEFFIDEFVIQSIFMILQKKSNKSEIRMVLKTLPKTGKILIVEENKKTRYERIKKTRFPGEKINKKFSIQWMKNSEFNYKILKNILLEDYGPIKKDFKI